MHTKQQLLYDALVAKIDAAEFFDTMLTQEIKWDARGQALVWCPFHNPSGAMTGKSPSLSISNQGQFNCHSGSCAVKGKNVIQFYEQLKKRPLYEAMNELYRTYVGPVIPGPLVDQYHSNLLSTPSLLQLLRTQRGITKETIKKFRLGFDNKRITIPVENEYGLVVNIRRYDHTRKEEFKILNYASGFGSLSLYPIQALVNDTVLLCEGEWDALLAQQMGFNAVTVTSGVGAWKAEFTELFKNKNVVICFDVNDKQGAGDKCAVHRATQLMPIAKSVKIVTLPLTEVGGDITDFFHKHKKTAKDFNDLIRSAPAIKSEDLPEADAAERPIETVHLGQASKSQYYNKDVKMTCMLAGKDQSPYMIPEHFSVSCKEAQRCDNCPLGAKQSEEYVLNLKERPELILQMVDKASSAIDKFLLAHAGFNPKCKAHVEITKAVNVERLQIIPEIDFQDIDSPYTMREGYYIGHGLEPNRPYLMTARTVPDPGNQQVVHVIGHADPAQTTIESFRMTAELQASLKKVFTPVSDRVEDIYEKLHDKYKYFARNITRIFDRPDLHLAIDLCYHSVLQLQFNNELIKGWIECLVLGDGRTGKGQVAERMMRHYRLGETVSAENCTFAGLVGGLQQFNDRWIITWGKIPLNDRRLLILDEVSSLSHRDIECMSRVRSEGIAEIAKIGMQRTNARTRMAWLGNPRSGETLSTYNTGVEAIRELVGKNEDIARFDYAITVSLNEVDRKVINRPAGPKLANNPYTSEICQNLILWAWSRKPNQVIFDSDAKTLILKHANEFGDKYSNIIPLVQGESVRHKIARVSVAMAVLMFSCTEDGESVVVTPGAVGAAVRFLNECYTKPSMGYSEFSKGAADHSELRNVEEIDKFIDGLQGKALNLVEGLQRIDRINERDIADYSGITNRDKCLETISMLVCNRAIVRRNSYYVKRPSFIHYLRNKVAQYATHGVPKPVRKPIW